MNLLPLGNIVAALIYAFIGILIFILSFVIIDKATPYHLWKEIVPPDYAPRRAHVRAQHCCVPSQHDR